MCGIVGCTGNKQAGPILLEGLKRLEYRGYDSAGIATLASGKLSIVKEKGKLDNLKLSLSKKPLKGNVGIGHTRWATHGEPSKLNAHPHVAGNTIAVVHNGIIENYSELKKSLYKKGYKFLSDTDSEVIAWLIYDYYLKSKDILKASQQCVAQLEGTFGILVICKDLPDTIVAIRRGSPLLIGIGKNEIYFASDTNAIVNYTNKIVYLKDNELAICEGGDYQIIDFENNIQKRDVNRIDTSSAIIKKGGYKHFLLKEIMEQPEVIINATRGRLRPQEGSAVLGGINLTPNRLNRFDRLLTIGCGSAYYAGLLGKYILERIALVPVDIEYASEFRYRQPVINKNTLALIISQSGETADSLASLKELKRKNIFTLGIINTVGSTIAREVDGGTYIHAGPEISVASTKAFSAQVIVQTMLAIQIARGKTMNITEGQAIVKAISRLPVLIQKVLDTRSSIEKIAKKVAKYNDVFYLGRDLLYPIALEGSLKLKEISYIHAEAYPAGEMKHGPIALIDKNFLSVFLCPQNSTYSKTLSNLEETKARGGETVIVASEGDKEVTKHSTNIISIPVCDELIQPLVVNVALQLFAYFVAVERGTDVDQPRNLAKSVTVE